MGVGETCIRVLGSFELVHDGRVVPVGGPVGQAIMTALACQPDTKVLPAQLITMVWGSPDVISADTLYHRVTRLRRVLAQAELTIVGHRPGYRLPVAAGQVDIACFNDLLRTSRALSDTDPDQAADRLRSALALWRGPFAVENVTLPGIRRLAAGWEARRLDAEEDLAEIDLRRGMPAQVLDRLHTLAAAHPHRPRLAAALARALHATGRTEQASTVLAEADRTARTGASAHPALARARQALATSARPPQEPIAPVPFQLPADTVRFTGRAEQVARLVQLCSTSGGSGNAVVPVIAIEGMAGVGKTALAVHVAHRLADRFTHGVLFTDLQGFTPDTDPTTPEQALDRLLRGLGVPGPQIPADLDARVGLYRSVLARRHVLIVLDNAAHETQLRPLLPAGAGCAVIVTSRRQLAGLDEALHLTLPVLDSAEAAGLFHGLAGDRATPADYPTIDRIVALCGRLPLAIRITAARLRLAPAATPAHLCAELEHALDAGRGLDWLSDGYRAAAAALAASYRHLTEDQQRTLRMAGLHPGADLEPYALAALADTAVEQARQSLEDLYAASLLDQSAYRRFRLHDLVAAFAGRLAAEVSEPDRQAALDRLYDHYAATSTLAIELAYPWEADQLPPPPAGHTPIPVLVDGAHAQDWLDTEIENLLAASHAAATGGRGDHALHQSATLRRHLRSRSHDCQAIRLHQQALQYARTTANPAAEQDTLNRLGDAHRIQGRHQLAIDCFEEALAGARRTGNRSAEQDALRGLGVVHFLQDRYEAAVDCLRQGQAIARQTANRNGEQYALNGLGVVHYLRGDYGSAVQFLERALAVARQTANRSGEQDALNGLGHVHRIQGRYGPAVDCLERALAIARQTGDRGCELDVLGGLGDVYYLQRRHEQAAGYYEQALAAARQAGEHGPFEAHQGLGRVHHAAANYHDALHHHQVALHLALDLAQPADQVCAHDGLARAHLSLGNASQARQHWQAALDLLARMGIDHTEEPEVTSASIRARIDALSIPSTT